MGVNIKVVFNRLNIKTVNGLYPIHFRVTIDRKSDYLHSGIKIKKEYWLGKENKWIKESHPDNHEINKRIKFLLERTNSYLWHLKNNERQINFKILKDFHQQKTDSKILNEFVNEFIKNKKWNNLNTRKTYITFQKHLNDFNPRIKFSELSSHLVKEFINFLEFDKKLKGVSIKKNKDKFVVITSEAIRQNLLNANNNPFFLSDIKIRIEKSQRTYLEIDEIKKIVNLSFTPEEEHLNKHRWHFIFLCLSGMYYNDLKKLKWVNLGKMEDGYYINDTRFKNGKVFQIPLYKFNTTTYIIDNFGDKSSEFVFPDTIEDQPFNRELKKIATKAGIKKNIYNKVGRHSYAQLMINLGMERQFLSRMLGHTKEETTSQYYKISIQDLENKISNINFKSVEL
ncbi:MAG: tyrosine-type recombinase/integrase [Bacteroidota bacterium]|nr:tyrosine-type recombinase/integrase [Bacteroidota bacterium]